MLWQYSLTFLIIFVILVVIAEAVDMKSRVGTGRGSKLATFIGTTGLVGGVASFFAAAFSLIWWL